MSSLVRSIALLGVLSTSAAAAEPGRVALESVPGIRIQFKEDVGRRVAANVDQWLIPAPAANPGMLGMFQVRDRKPVPQIVPWAGEFAGKYLMSAVPTLQLSQDARLKPALDAFVSGLLAGQDADGYLGPFPKKERLLGHWDLWGHDHVMLGLLRWYAETHDRRALEACRKMAALVKATYPDRKKSFFDAGSHEMNMAIVHALGRLDQVDPNSDTRATMLAVLKDWERAGDYLRTGLAGVDFFRTPRPRWESLADLQGLVVLYELTGETQYRDAFLHHWRSIRRTDRHNTGGFSTGEQACGDPYEPGAIETCCTIAWMAITLDALRLTGDPAIADELELSTENAGLGAQHPSGRWWTYSTPMDGVREASAHAIVFQARAGTPELNCCSVNGPRALSMLADWAVMTAGPGALVINSLRPLDATVPLEGVGPVRIQTTGAYPRGHDVSIRIDLEKPAKFRLDVRLPARAGISTIEVPGMPQRPIKEVGYLTLDRTWFPGDTIHMKLALPLQVEAGDRATAGQASIYRGPLLLAFDPAFNKFDADALPTLTPADRERAWVVVPNPIERSQVEVTVPLNDGRELKLIDYASAGSSGTPYRSWLPARAVAPPAPLPVEPDDGAKIPPGAFVVAWRPSPLSAETTYRVVVSESASLEKPVLQFEQKGGDSHIVSRADAKVLQPGRDYYWGMTATNSHGATPNLGPARRLRVNGELPARAEETLAARAPRPDGLLVVDALDGKPVPTLGKLESSEGTKPGEKTVITDGQRGRLIYAIDGFPTWDYAVSVRVKLGIIPKDRLAQVFSAWAGNADDPLRIVLDRGRLFARLETGGAGASTNPGVTVEPGKWVHLAAVKRGSTLTLYVDGKAASSTTVPVGFRSATRAVALGGNPRFSGNEYLNAEFADLRVLGRALEPAELAALAKPR
ncbi:MAG: glycoside hydrolase family 127 protein [Isosphaeraceae bacterium]